MMFKSCIFLFALLLFAEVLPAQGIIPVEDAGRLPSGRARHGCVFHNKNLYVVGGQDGWNEVHHRTIFRSPVDENGYPTTWVVQSALPGSRTIIRSNTLIFREKMYIVGGYDGEMGQWTNTVLMAEMFSDGEIGAWQELAGSPIPGEDNEGMCVVNGSNSLIAIGGRGPGGCTNKVRIAMLTEQGVILNWLDGAPLPTTLAYASAATVSGRVYVWGGMETVETTPLNTKVFSAELLRDGTIGPWRTEPAVLEQGFFEGGNAQLGFFLFTFSPKYENSQYTPEFFWASLKSGSLGRFGQVTIAASSKEGAGIAANPDHNIIYITGGRQPGSGPGLTDVQFVRMK